MTVSYEDNSEFPNYKGGEGGISGRTDDYQLLVTMTALLFNRVTCK